MEQWIRCIDRMPTLKEEYCTLRRIGRPDTVKAIYSDFILDNNALYVELEWLEKIPRNQTIKHIS